MLVSTMTIEEVRKEFLRDYPSAIKRGMVELGLLEKEAQRNHVLCTSRVIDYTSSYRNHWLLFIHYESENQTVSPVMFYHDTSGIVTYHLIGKEEEPREQHILLICPGHFFSRLNERLKLGKKNPMQIVKYFFKRSHNFPFLASEPLNEGRRLWRTKIFGGMGLGYLQREENYACLKTFLSQDITSESQDKLLELLERNDPTAFSEFTKPHTYTDEQVKAYLS